MGSLWNRSGTIERFADDLRASGAKAFFFMGGTTTPLTVYKNNAQTSAHAIPVVADANGRWPDIFVPFISSYDVQTKTADDVQLTFTLGVPNINPVEAVPTVPVNSLLTTGMIHGEFSSGAKEGYVRLNGKSIGNPASSATERANDDTQDLFTYLWNNLPQTIANVSSGRGGSPAADFAANKTIDLPGMRGLALSGIDGMGNTVAGVFPGLAFAVGDSVTPGSVLGSNGITLDETQMPPHSHGGATDIRGAHTHPGSTVAGTTGNDNFAHQHNVTVAGNTDPAATGITASFTASAVTSTPGGAGGTLLGGGTTVVNISDPNHSHHFSATATTTPPDASHQHPFSATPTIASDGEHQHVIATDSKGGGAQFNNMPSTRLVTWYIKL